MYKPTPIGFRKPVMSPWQKRDSEVRAWYFCWQKSLNIHKRINRDIADRIAAMLPIDLTGHITRLRDGVYKQMSLCLVRDRGYIWFAPASFGRYPPCRDCLRPVVTVGVRYDRCGVCGPMPAAPSVPRELVDRMRNRFILLLPEE